MTGAVRSRAFWRQWATRRLAAMDDRRGVKFLLRLQDRLSMFTLGVIKTLEGDAHPRHRLTDATAYFHRHVRVGDRVLDVGSGYGHNAAAIADCASTVVGLEIRAEAVARAQRERARPNVEYRVGTLADLAAEECFDVVLLGNVLEHIEDRQVFLGACRARAPRLLVRVPAADRDWLVAYRRELGLPWKLHPDHEIEYTADTLAAELDEAGYRVTDLTTRYGAIHCAAETR